MQYGMSDEVGVVFHSNNDSSSPEMRATIDKEVQRLLASSYKRATKLLEDNRKDLDLIAKALMDEETLSGAEIKALLAGKRLKKGK